MNKAFKVLWNQVRNTYVVASEAQATHGKPSKATKTLVAAAVAGLMAAGSASATTITNDTLGEGHQAFIQGNGETLEIQTDGSFGGILSQLQQNHNGLKAILNGLIQNDGTHKSIVGVTGGKVYSSEYALLLADVFEEGSDYFNGIVSFERITEPVQNSSGTNVLIGGEDSDPVVMAVSGGDILFNVNLGDGAQDLEVTRDESSKVELSSGITLGGVAGGSAINANVMLKDGVTSSATTIQNGSSNLIIKGTSSALGMFGGGMSVAVGPNGTATSIVNGTSNVKVNTTVDDKALEGLVVGVGGAGLSVAMGGSTAVTQTQGTVIDLEHGMILGTIGGGMALTSDPSILAEVGGSVGSLAGQLGDTGGDAQSMVLGDTTINATAGSTTALLMGGGIAIANAEKGESNATATTLGDVTINLEGGDNVFNDEEGSEDNKIAFHIAAGKFIDFGKEVFNQLTNNKVPFDVESFISGLQQSVKDLNYQGVHVGNLGAGIAVANGVDGIDGAVAKADVNGTVYFNLKGGYNVANMAGGIAIAKGGSNTTADKPVSATTTTGATLVEITGGENILVAAGGAAFATAGEGYNTEVKAESKVGTAKVNVRGGITDGIYGGGIAIDDTNQTDPNAIANVNSIYINVSDGVVNEANTSKIVEIVGEGSLTSTGAPGKRAYIYDTVKLIDQANVAILGAGMATGGGATADTQYSQIKLTGGTINGSVFGGGAATFDGSVNVGESWITVNGEDVTVNGSIYGGGLVGGPKNDSSTYNSPKSHVETSTIALLNGTVTGDIFAGGYVYKDETGAAQKIEQGATVETSQIILGSNEILTKKDATVDGQGANSSTLTFVTDDFDMTDKNVIGFNTIEGNAQSVKNLNYTFGKKETTDVTGNVNFASITGDNTKTMNIGTTESAGIASISDDSTVAAKLNVANGLLALNSDTTDAALSAFSGAGVKNALYVTGTVEDGWSVAVGENAQATETGIVIGSNGALIADADGHTVVETGVTMAEGSKIHFADVAKAAAQNAQVNIAVDPEAATSVDNVLYTVSGSTVDNLTRYTFTQRTGSELEEVGLGDVDDTEALIDVAGQDDSASDYINNFLDESTSSVNNGNRSQQINAAMNLAAAAGVQTVAIDSATMGIDAAAKCASLINDFAEGGVLFAEATGKRFEMGGSSDFGAIKTELGGIVVGGEYTTGDWTFGALANLGTGTVRGQDANSGVKNDVDYYGVQAYAAKRLGAFNVVGQVGYVQTSNDVTHTTVGMEKADIDADVMSVGVRGEMRFDLTQNTRLVPYVGVNYLRVSTDGFHTDQGLEVKDQDQDLVTIPVGVKFAGDMQTASGWTWTPSVDVGYVAALGDRDTDARTKVGATTVHTSMDVWSESVVRTSVGLKAQKDNWGFGVQAGSAMGSDDTKELFGQVRVDYRF